MSVHSPSSLEISQAIASVCVTGTNGKSTTTTMIEAIVAASGEPSGRVTTLGSWVAGEQLGSDTSVEAFMRAVARAVEVGVKTLAIETTSQALGSGFCEQWQPRVGVFTNLSRDHLDVHRTPENYLAAKAQLFMHLPEGGAAVLNGADPASALLAEVTPAGVRKLGYAARPVHANVSGAGLSMTLCAEATVATRRGTRITLAKTPLGERLGGRLDLRIVGDVHAENALAAAVAADALGYDAEAIARGLGGFEGVPGRFQEVGAAPFVVVDFAHTPDALERTLKLARAIAVEEGGRVVCVFGCGGDRDPGKRSEMGRIAATLAQRVVITTDNPRSEDPERIAASVFEGTRGSSSEVERIHDRAEAIQSAIWRAAPADVVVVAGKGHEKTQIVSDRVIPFDDVAIAREALGQREGGASRR